MPPINERIKALISYYANGVVSAFSDLLEGVSQQKLNRLFNRDTRTNKYPVATTDILVAITEKFVNVNPVWLLTGAGEMLLPINTDHSKYTHTPVDRRTINLVSEPNITYNDPPTLLKIDPPNDPPTQILVPQIITVDNYGDENILHVNAKAAAGYLRGYGDREYISTLPSFKLPGLTNGTYRSFEVVGDSMYPTLKSGQMVIGRWVERLDHIRDDRVYIVVHKTRGIVIKRLLNRLHADQKAIIAKSDATNDRGLYKSYKIAADEIQELWYAVFHGGFDFQPPSDMWNRLNNIEAELTELRSIVKAGNTNES